MYQTGDGIPRIPSLNQSFPPSPTTTPPLPPQTQPQPRPQAQPQPHTQPRPQPHPQPFWLTLVREASASLVNFEERLIIEGEFDWYVDALCNLQDRVRALEEEIEQAR